VLLGRRQPVLDVAVAEDLVERAAEPVLADDVRRDALLAARAREEERERPAKERPDHGGDCITLERVRRHISEGRFAERSLVGVDEAGREEQVVIWIERKPGALWAVGRTVNAHLRASDAPRPDDYVFEGYELEDCLEAANACLSDDERVSQQDGRGRPVEDFTREELLKPLERWFFSH
jgi:hypothetical protein